MPSLLRLFVRLFVAVGLGVHGRRLLPSQPATALARPSLSRHPGRAATRTLDSRLVASLSHHPGRTSTQGTDTRLLAWDVGSATAAQDVGGGVLSSLGARASGRAPTLPGIAAPPALPQGSQGGAQGFRGSALAVAAVGLLGGLAAAVWQRSSSRQCSMGGVSAAAAGEPTKLPTVDRATTKEFRRDFTRSDKYFRFGKNQMEEAAKTLSSVSGSELVTRIRKNGFRLTIGDVTFVLAESYGFCWGVERTLAMVYEARKFFPDKPIWVTNEIIHNKGVNDDLAAMGMKFVPKTVDGGKDFSGVQEGDVVVLPAFGASVDEMALLKERKVQVVDTTCPWVTRVWTSVEKSKGKGHTVIIHGKSTHEETVATKSFASTFLVIKNMSEAEYVAGYILDGGSRDEFLKKFAGAMSDGFDPDEDLMRVGVANQTTMLKGETELIGKLFERTMIRRYGPQHINEHYLSFNTICDATQERQDAMYKMFGAEYEAPISKLYAELENEQIEVELLSEKNASKLSSKAAEDISRGQAGQPSAEAALGDVNLVLCVGGFNSSNTTHLIEIPQELGVPAYHIDCALRIGGMSDPIQNTIQHKPLSTSPADAILEQGLEIKEGFLPDGPVVVGITSGASTPDASLGACLERLLAVRGLSADQPKA